MKIKFTETTTIGDVSNTVENEAEMSDESTPEQIFAAIDGLRRATLGLPPTSYSPRKRQS